MSNIQTVTIHNGDLLIAFGGGQWKAEITGLRQMPDGNIVATSIKMFGDEKTPYYGMLIPAFRIKNGELVPDGETFILFERSKIEKGILKCGDLVAVFRYRYQNRKRVWYVE